MSTPVCPLTTSTKIVTHDRFEKVTFDQKLFRSHNYTLTTTLLFVERDRNQTNESRRNDLLSIKQESFNDMPLSNYF